MKIYVYIYLSVHTYIHTCYLVRPLDGEVGVHAHVHLERDAPVILMCIYMSMYM